MKKIILSGCMAALVAGSWQCLPRHDHRAIPHKLFDWQGHRGCRGKLPENTIPAFIQSLEWGVKTLEMDLAISADGVVMVSHEPWMSADICSKPDGQAVTAVEAPLLSLYKMTVKEIQNYDCGLRRQARFPEQKTQEAVKPRLDSVIKAVKDYCLNKRRSLPYFNIEIKTQPAWDGQYTPAVTDFVKIVLETVRAADIENRTCIQSFDVRALEATHVLNPKVEIAYLVENSLPLAENLKKLSFIPHVYSPYFQAVNPQMVADCRRHHLRLIPWTVNEVADMQRLKNMGVHGIITDYPDRIKLVK